MTTNRLSTVLTQLMREVDINESQLAKAVGIKQPVLNRIRSSKTKNPKVDTLKPLANFFVISIDQLMGHEPLSHTRIPGIHNPYGSAWQKVPLLNAEQVLMWPSHLFAMQKYLPTVYSDIDLGEHGYAIQVPDTAMHPKFSEGTTLLVHMEVTPEHRDCVLVKIEDDPTLHFKSLLIDGKSRYLQSFNSSFKTICLDGRSYKILGVILQARVSLKQCNGNTKKMGS